LTRAEYERVEDAYVSVALAFLNEAGAAGLTITGLENHRGVSLAFGEGSVLPLGGVGAVIRRVLCEEFWCRLEGAEVFIHVGYDFYMYLGVPRVCPHAEQLARELGLFAELFPSPYQAKIP